MKVDISHPSASKRQYILQLIPETGNEEILLHFLTEDRDTPFYKNSEGDTVVNVREFEMTRDQEVGPIIVAPAKRKLSQKGKKAISKAQKARWKKFKKLGKMPLQMKKPKTSSQLRIERYSKVTKGFWSKMTPAQRKAEMNRRKRVAAQNRENALTAANRIIEQTLANQPRIVSE